MKKTTIILSLFAIILVSCGSPKPAAIIQKYIDLKQANKLEEAVHLFSERRVKETGIGNLKARGYGLDGTVTTPSIKSESIVGEIAEVEVIAAEDFEDYFAGRILRFTYIYTYKLVKENGSWKIDELKQTLQP